MKAARSAGIRDCGRRTSVALQWRFCSRGALRSALASESPSGSSLVRVRRFTAGARTRKTPAV
jgi:hypothetical protein